jgi:hypothetical protein
LGVAASADHDLAIGLYGQCAAAEVRTFVVNAAADAERWIERAIRVHPSEPGAEDAVAAAGGANVVGDLCDREDQAAVG